MERFPKYLTTCLYKSDSPILFFLRKKSGEKAKQEIFLEFKHVGIKATLAVSMAFDIQKQLSCLTWLDFLRHLYQLE
jgi:hypothetical protein